MKLTLRIAAFLTPFALLLVPCRLEGGTHTWKGGTSLNWSAAANWVEGVAPAVAEANLVLSFPPGAPNFGLTNDLPNLTVQAINFTEGAYQIGGLPITLSTSVTFGSSVANTFVQIGVVVTLSGAVTVTIGNNLGLGFETNLGGPGSLTKAGAGGLQLFGNNTYQGATTIQAGTVTLFDTPTGLGSAGMGTSVASGAFLYANGTMTVPEPVDLANGATLGCGYGSVVWSGAVTLSGLVFANVNTNTGASLTITGLVSGPAGIFHGGGGPLVLANNNTYTGSTLTGYGNALLVVNGSQPQSDVSVANGGSLGGSGTVGAVSTNGGGTITPGSSPGVLSTRAVSLGALDTLHIELNGATPGVGYDQVNAAGDVGLGGSTLQVVLGFMPQPGTVFTIVQTTGTASGTFAGLADNATFQVSGQGLRIHYTSSAVTLTAVCAMADSTPPTVVAPQAVTVKETVCN